MLGRNKKLQEEILAQKEEEKKRKLSIAPAPIINNNSNNLLAGLMNTQNDVFSKVMTFQNQQPSILEEDNSLDTFTDTGKKYGDYFYFDYENKKDNKIYKKGNNYYLFDDKTNSYVDVNQATNRFTDKKLEKEELEKAKQLGYKEPERRTSKEYDKANSVFKKLQKQYKLSDKELQNFIDNGDLSQKHVSLVTNSMRNTTREAVKYRNDIKEGKIKQYDDTVLSINDRLDLDTANLTNKKYNEYEEDLLRQQEAKDNQKDRINYGYDGTLSGTLKALNSTKNKVNDKIDKEVIYPIKHAKENYELGKKNNQLALEYYKKMEGKKNNAEELAQEMDKYQYFNKDLINNPGWAGTAIQNANTQVESLKKQGIGATVLGTIGSVIGTVINPGAGTVAGLKAGSSIGYTLGSTPYTYKLEAGNQYKTLLDMGVPDKIAKKHSKRVGAINAAIESGENIIDLFTFNSGSGTKAITKQTVSDLVDEYGEKQVNSWLSKKIGDKAANMMVTSAKSYLQNIASESAEEMTQEASSIVGERLAAKESNVDRNVSLKDDLSRVLEAGSSAAISTAFTAPISSVSGSIATNTMNNIQSKIENKVVKSNVINNEIMKEINKSNSNISNEDALNIQRQVYQELDNNGIEIVNAQQNTPNLSTEMTVEQQNIDNNINSQVDDNAKNSLATIQNNNVSGNINKSVDSPTLKNEIDKSSKLKNYSINDIKRFSTGNNLINGYNSDLKSFVSRYYDENTKSAKKKIAPVKSIKMFLGRINDDLSSKINTLLNDSNRFDVQYDTKDTNVVISSDNIEHIYKRHGNEKYPGQIDVTPENLSKYDEVVSNPDYIGLSSQLSRGKTPTIYFTKKINGYSVAVEVLSTKKQLYPESYYVFESNSKEYDDFIKNNKLKKAEDVKSGDVMSSDINVQDDTSVAFLDNNTTTNSQKKQIAPVSQYNMQQNEKNIPIATQGLYNRPSSDTTSSKNDTELANSSFSLKEKQLEIIKKENPMLDDYHTGIRTIDDIKTPEEAFKTKIDEDEDYSYPDFTQEDGEKALESGKITVYSSQEIKQGTFVSPSKSMAQDYAGDGKIFEQTISINDVAWINSDEGQYAKVDNSKYSQKAPTWQEHLEKNYKSTGKRTYFDEMTNTTKKAIAPISNEVKKISNEIKELKKEISERKIPIAKEYQNNTIDEKKSNKDEYIRIANTINETIKGNTIVGSEVKERSWIETPLESEVVKDKVLIEDLDPDKINYTVKSNKKTLKKANKKIELMGYEESVKYIKSKLNDDNISLTDIVMGERIIQEASKKGDKQLASDLITDIAILGTELGQKTQALSIIQRLTPEGQLKMFQKIVKRAKIRGEKSFQDVEITPEMVELILDAYDKNGNFNQDDLNNRVEQFKQEIADQLKTSTAEKIDAWRYLSMLGNPKTHIRNIVSNVAMKGTVAYKNALARTLETVLPIKNRTKTWKKTSEEVKQYAKQTAIEMKDTITGNNKFSEKGSIESKKRIFKNKFLESLSNFNSDMLELEDWFFSKSAFINSFQEYLTANGIMTKEDINNNSEIIEKGKNYAVEQAEIATFRQYSKLASEINRIERNNKVAKYPIKAMVPFKKTPINVAKTGVKYSPLGLIKNISYDVVQLKKGNIEASQFIDNLSQGVAGTSLMLLGYGLSKAGILLGSGDDDKEGKYDSLLGKTGYSIKIGNKYYSLSWLSPVAMPLFVGSNFYEQLEEKKGWDMNVVSDTLAKTLDPLSEMSFVSSLNDALSSYGSGTDKIFSMGESVAQSYIGQFFPTLFSQFSNTFDDTKRSTKASSNSSYKFGEQTLRSIMYKIPGLHNKLEPSVDVWGNELKQSNNVLTRAFESFIAPYSARKDITSKLDKEIKRVYKEVGNDDVIPGVPRTDITYKKEKYRMSASEYTNYRKEYGESANTMLKMLINSDNYKDSSDTRKTRMIKKIYDYSKEIAKTEFLEKRKIKFDDDDFKTSTMDYEDIVDYILRNTRYMDGE